MKLTSLGLGALLLVGLSACGQKPAPATSNDAAATAGDAAAATTRLGQKVREATEKAREKMATSNISVSEGASTLPKAEITPQGDLLIGGKQVTINEQQRALLLQHRANVTAMALAGMGSACKAPTWACVPQAKRSRASSTAIPVRSRKRSKPKPRR